MQKWVLVLALPALLASAACEANEADYLTVETISVAFDGMRTHADPNKPYRELVQRLEKMAANEARDGDFTPVSIRRDWGRVGQRMLVGAITPRKGVFYLSEYGAYGPANELQGGGAVVVRKRDQISACRFTVEWADLPGGAYGPGLLWVGGAFPSIDCKPPTPEDLTHFAEQRRISQEASYRAEASTTASGLKMTVIREVWPAKYYGPKPPFDAGRAIQAAIGEPGKLALAIPVSTDVTAYARTRGGRDLFALADPFETWQQRACVVEGLTWNDMASGNASARMVEGRELCKRLFEESRTRYGQELDRKAKSIPPEIRPTDQN